MTVRAEFEGQAPGILYVADCHEESPYTSADINRCLASVITLDVLVMRGPATWPIGKSMTLPFLVCLRFFGFIRSNGISRCSDTYQTPKVTAGECFGWSPALSCTIIDVNDVMGFLMQVIQPSAS